MTLAEGEIARIDAALVALGAEGDPGALAAALVRLLPGVTLRQCDAGDVLEEPFRQVLCADIHLLDASGHCIRVTGDPAEANALLVARKAAS